MNKLIENLRISFLGLVCWELGIVEVITTVGDSIYFPAKRLSNGIMYQIMFLKITSCTSFYHFSIIKKLFKLVVNHCTVAFLKLVIIYCHTQFFFYLMYINNFWAPISIKPALGIKIWWKNIFRRLTILIRKKIIYFVLNYNQVSQLIFQIWFIKFTV